VSPTAPLLLVEAIGQDEGAERFAAISAGRPFAVTTVQRFRTLCAVVRLGFELCSARERPVEPTPGVVERSLEPLLPGFVCASSAMQRVADQIQRLQGSDLTVLITGESGTGKDLVARAIHAGSSRGDGTYLPYNCTSATRELADSQLFGHRRGSFTGAVADQSGVIRSAIGGTIFLDEVGELPLDLQTKLLRVLQENEFEPVGSSRTKRVDVRVIAATNRNLEEAVREGSFRSDLYYRLSIFPITLPPLRDRKDDIATLTRHFVQELSHKLGKQIDSIPHETMMALKNYPWPGNIRELRNVIERAVIITEGSTLRLLDSFESLWLKEGELRPFEDAEAASTHANGWGETLEESQYNLILQTLKKSYWRIEGPYGAAAALKVHPSKLRSMMKRLGITRPKSQSHSGGVA
jgi:formate hydrogenlyase transcriptional activator